MGIDVHTLKFLKFASKKQPLGRVATVGRMGLHVPKDRLKQIMNLSKEIDYGAYCEEFLKAEFGAITVESFDRSDYENATHIVDMNCSIGTHLRYDTILDGGCLEHIYNVPQAFANLSTLCAEEGQILHVLPANNLCGHGFWQFSPELFFSLYSEPNGYRGTQVFLADVTNEDEWYEVRRPQNGRRVEIVSSSSVFVMVRALRTGPFSHENVNQLDYERIWSGNTNVERSEVPLSQRTDGRLLQALLPAARFAERRWQRLVRPAKSLSESNPHLTKHKIASVVSETRIHTLL
jgi:hypothetical protein